LSRELTPHDFGLVSIVAFFLLFSEPLVNSGFSTALIRKNDCSDSDYSTVFFYNLLSSLLLYFFIFLLAPFMAQLFHEEQLTKVLRILTLIIVIDAFGLTHRTILIKDINFKPLASFSNISLIGSGVIAVFLVYSGFGIWSLVGQRISRQLISSCLYWYGCKWKPKLLFDKKAFIEFFNFGSRLVFSGLINTVVGNIQFLVIGKYFSTLTLGHYSRAQDFANIPTQSFTGIVGRVAFPILMSYQNDQSELKKKYKILLKSAMLVTSLLIFILISVAEPLFLTLIGEKWRQSILYFRLLSF
jgi:O-antigen/teichoic acid export membrane protein